MTVHAKEAGSTNYAPYIALPVFIVGFIFVWRSFYSMRIPLEEASKKLPSMGAASDAYDIGNPLMDCSAKRGISARRGA